ncbi:MAG: phosphatidic acid phosphatase, partial [Chitinophagaceae bacterium]
MRSGILFVVMIVCMHTYAHANDNWKQQTENANFIHRAVKQVTDVMVHDIYSPPVASRTYAYLSIAAYEALAAGDSSYRSLAGQLKDLKALPGPEQGKEYSYTVAAVHAVLAIGKALVISEQSIDAFVQSITQELKQSGIPAATFDNSVAFGQQVAKHIMDWASRDQYKQTRTFTKYAVTDVAAYWKPTPPAYMRAVEPHWNKIRTFVLDSARQFPPAPPTAFSPEKDSPFFKEAMAVHEVGLKLTQEQKDIANFWDCNPFKMNVSGHVMYASKKISPGGHWMNINRLACQKTNASPVQSVEAYALLAITIADAFISCWDEK